MGRIYSGALAAEPVVVYLCVPTLCGSYFPSEGVQGNKSEFANTLDVEQITWDRGTSAGILAAGQCRANFVVL